jgi:cell division ATPase FtsA
MAGITDFVERLFGMPCTIGKPRNVSGLATAASGPEYATACGIVQYGFKTAREPARGLPLPDWLNRILAR